MRILDIRAGVPVSLVDSRGAIAYKGMASYDPWGDALVRDDQVIPQTILFESAPGDLTLRMRVETRNGVTACTAAQLEADSHHEVRTANHKALRIEAWVTDIVAACARERVRTSPTGHMLIHGPATPEQKKVARGMQRRRRDPQVDRELHERVAAIHQLHPEAPNPAVAAEFGVSERTASRWAQYASDAGLLPKAKQGQKRA